MSIYTLAPSFKKFDRIFILKTFFRNISKFELILIGFCVLLSIFGGIASTYSSVQDLVNPQTFVPPCYLNRTQ